MATISISREELMTKLLEAKGRADKVDARNLAKHQKEEAESLERFRKNLREALKWEWAKVKNNHYDVGLRSKDMPRCPNRHARPIEIAISQIKMDTRKGRFRLADNSDWYKAATWVADPPKHTICD